MKKAINFFLISGTLTFVTACSSNSNNANDNGTANETAVSFDNNQTFKNCDELTASYDEFISQYNSFADKYKQNEDKYSIGDVAEYSNRALFFMEASEKYSGETETAECKEKIKELDKKLEDAAKKMMQ